MSPFIEAQGIDGDTIRSAKAVSVPEVRSVRTSGFSGKRFPKRTNQRGSISQSWSSAETSLSDLRNALPNTLLMGLP